MWEALLTYFLKYLMEMRKDGRERIAYMMRNTFYPSSLSFSWSSRSEGNHSVLLPLCNFVSWAVTTLFASRNGNSVDQLLKEHHLLWRSFVT
jgi:hypothetical protein